jgi:hypothetical protein
MSLSASTLAYINENKRLDTLPRYSHNYARPKRLIGWSLRSLLKEYLRTSLQALYSYPSELWLGRKYLKKSLAEHKRYSQKRSLVIGNGPSQGYLTPSLLNQFIASGGETICVNYWSSNRNLSSHTPTWMVFSDPKSFSQTDQHSINLVNYLRSNPQIKLVIPFSFVKIIDEKQLANEAFGFVDTELPYTRNINPMAPRGYLSMTLYKALAWSIYLGYSEIGVIGMDNTYPRNIYCDANNHILNLETHAGLEDYILDLASEYSNMAAILDSIVRLFRDLDYFPPQRVANLDPYSLTDRFKKVSLVPFVNGGDASLT